MAGLWGGPPNDSVELEQTGFVRSADQPIPGATVSATQATTVVTTSSDQAGHYSFRVGPGVWVVEVTMVGFRSARKTLTVSDKLERLDFTLQLKEPPVAARRGGSSGVRLGEQNPNEFASQIVNDL